MYKLPQTRRVSWLGSSISKLWFREEQQCSSVFAALKLFEVKIKIIIPLKQTKLTARHRFLQVSGIYKTFCSGSLKFVESYRF